MTVRLAAIGQPWAIREIVAAVPEIDNVMIRESIAALLRTRGLNDDAQDARLADPDDGDLGSLNMLDNETLGGIRQVMQIISTDPEISRSLDEWAEEVRAGLPDGFGAEPAD